MALSILDEEKQSILQELTCMTMTMKTLLSCEFHFDQEIIMSKILDHTITISRYYQAKRK